MDDRYGPEQVFVAAFVLASFGGLATLLRSNAVLTVRSMIATLCYSGLAGLIVVLLWYKNFNGAGNIYFLLGLSVLAGIGGSTVIDLLLQSMLRMIKAGGLNITLGPPSTTDSSKDTPGPPKE